MTERDPSELAAQRQGEADEMQQRLDRLTEQVQETREDWERKRADDDVPGAAPLPLEDEDGRPSSPAPQSPPEQEGPADAEAASEGATGPPADTLDEDA
jgi:hypothetical protein